MPTVMRQLKVYPMTNWPDQGPPVEPDRFTLPAGTKRVTGYRVSVIVGNDSSSYQGGNGRFVLRFNQNNEDDIPGIAEVETWYYDDDTQQMKRRSYDGGRLDLTSCNVVVTDPRFTIFYHALGAGYPEVGEQEMKLILEIER